ncbi:hypothetical protein [Corynebacterium sp. 13CS0277]|uniref:hypothetical protein n=1 Tax=Corynebacterium sp. 13CS0277 TaxID=2071994 RepID=UPI0011B1F28D|nr:hypothetical protein [Corynebacterium sp. 13CS0277]
MPTVVGTAWAHTLAVANPQPEHSPEVEEKPVRFPACGTCHVGRANLCDEDRDAVANGWTCR